MLPNKKIAVLLGHMNPEAGGAPEEADDGAGMMAAAEDLIAAIHGKDAAGVAAALQAAFDLCDSAPHQEAPEEG